MCNYGNTCYCNILWHRQSSKHCSIGTHHASLKGTLTIQLLISKTVVASITFICYVSKAYYKWWPYICNMYIQSIATHQWLFRTDLFDILWSNDEYVTQWLEVLKQLVKQFVLWLSNHYCSTGNIHTDKHTHTHTHTHTHDTWQTDPLATLSDDNGITNYKE